MINTGVLEAKIAWGEKPKMKQKIIPSNGETMKVKFCGVTTEQAINNIIAFNKCLKTMGNGFL